jgi:leader peptidase (prepilin peptidase)/N-methyltransferase
MTQLELLAANPAAAATGALLLGLVVGSFLNVVIHRLPIMMDRHWQAHCRELAGDATAPLERFDLLTPPSRCPACDHRIGVLENIPVISYLLQRGRCRHCATPISIQYPLVELFTAVISAIVVLKLGVTIESAAALCLTWALIALAVIDFHHQLLPDAITLPFLWVGLALALADITTDLRSSVIGAMAGYLVLWVIFQGFRLITGREGMGYGDFKLLAMLGAWLGWQYLPAIVIVSSLVGAVLGLSLIAFRGRQRSAPLPFGPFLAAAGWITLLWGERINQGYLSLSGLG